MGFGKRLSQTRLMLARNAFGSRTSRAITLADARAIAWTWIGKLGAGTRRRVSGAEEGQAHVAEPLFRADRGDDLGLGVEVDAEPPLVPRGDLAAEVQDPGGDAVAVVSRSCAASQSLSMTHCSGGSVGLPIPRSMTSIPSRRFRYFRSLILPKR